MKNLNWYVINPQEFEYTLACLSDACQQIDQSIQKKDFDTLDRMLRYFDRARYEFEKAEFAHRYHGLKKFFRAVLRVFP